jgi:hypothetical protein
MTYRDDLQAARMRREALRRELRQVRSRMHEHLELTKQEQALEQELAQCAQDIDQARARAELPLLQRLHVASPCKERWDDMTGDERVRFCGRCAKNVYDLSALTASQAEELLRERGESLCVRFFRRSDGTILTSDCPTGRQRKRFWRRVTTAAVASGLAAAGLTMAPTTMESATAGDTTHESLRPDVVALKKRLQGVRAGDMARPSSPRDVLYVRTVRYGDAVEGEGPVVFLPAGTLAREEAARAEQDRARRDAKVGKHGKQRRHSRKRTSRKSRSAPAAGG